MTRIAAGAGTPNQPSIDDPPADAVQTALPAGPAIAPAGTRSSSVAGDAGPDRPAPKQGAGGRSVATDAGVFLKALSNGRVSTLSCTPTRVVRDDGNRPSAQDARRRAETAVAPQQDRATRDVCGDQVDVRARPPSGGSFKQDHPNAKGIPSASVRESVRSGSAGRSCHQTGDEPPEDGVPPAPAKAVSGFHRYPLLAQHAIVDMGYNLGVARLKHEVSRLRGGVQSRRFFDAAKESIVPRVARSVTERRRICSTKRLG